ncbi:hypothetical protein [Desulfuromonas sp. TF]|uniref:hypothetical protein n=1 Tax=Desulfuromonas sp. TF TaxID=1232410 RepID=UPI0012DEA604|nr:hypothetical protein [Desulfuromonas sp. TF]
MRGFILLFVVLSLGACETSQKNQKPSFEEASKKELQSQANVTNLDQKTDELNVIQQDLTFTDIIRTEGVPTKNIIPRKKEQLAIYNKGEKISVYYFKENKLYSKKYYSTQEMMNIEGNSEYPKNLFKALGVIK